MLEADGAPARLVLQAAEALAAAGIEAPRHEAWLLLAHATGQERAALIAARPGPVAAAARERFAALVARRAGREPIAYLLGEREFWSLPFAVGPEVLVPRPDSETLVEAVLAALPDRAAPLRLLDLGTGSGCLLLALLSELPAAVGLGVDRSLAALAMAERNAARLSLAGRARFLAGSWGAALGGGFDLIVSNPPYIPAPMLAGLTPEVRDFEPQGALAAGEDGLDAYRALLPDVARLLAPGGLAALELGQGQAAAVEALARAAGLAPAGLRRDLAGIERCLLLRRH